MAGNYKARSAMSVIAAKQLCPGTYWWLDWAPGNRTETCDPTFQFHAGHFLVNIERQVAGIMYRHLSAQGAFSDMSVRLFEILQKTWGQNILYLGKYCEGLKIPCL